MSKINETGLEENAVDLYPQTLSDEDIIEFLSSGGAHNDLDEIDGYEERLSDTDELELKAAGYNARYRGFLFPLSQHKPGFPYPAFLKKQWIVSFQHNHI